MAIDGQCSQPHKHTKIMNMLMSTGHKLDSECMTFKMVKTTIRSTYTIDIKCGENLFEKLDSFICQLHALYKQ